MKKQEQTKKIIQQLLKHNKITMFMREDIDKAVKRVTWSRDQRTFDRWFQFLFDMEFLIQPKYQVYSLNLERIMDLEVKIDPEQRKLFNV